MRPFVVLTMIFALVLISLNQVAGVIADNSETIPTTHASIPQEVFTYLSIHPADHGCLSGTMNPFSIRSTSCPRDTASIPPQSSNTQSLDCSNNCKAGVALNPSSNFVEWQADATTPGSNPTQIYYNPPTYMSYWVGLQSCIGSCSGTVYLVQEGILYGGNSYYDSQHPLMFEEFYASSGTCSTTFCGSYFAITPGDLMSFSGAYYSPNNQWVLMSLDWSTNPYTYDIYYVSVGSSSYQIPYTSLAWSASVTEGVKTTSASYWPAGTAMFTNEVGRNSNGNYQLGTGYWVGSPTGTAPTATLTYSTFSCNVSGTHTTCSSTQIAMS